MAGELEPMPLADILGGVGYRTAMGVWPPGFDEAYALLTLVNLTERMRHCIVAHHEAHPHLYNVTEYPCQVCMNAQGAKPDDVLTDLKVPDFPPDDIVVPRRLINFITDGRWDVDGALANLEERERVEGRWEPS